GGALKYDHNSRLEINGSLDVGSMERTSDLPHTGSFVTWYLGSLRVRSDVTTFDLGFSNLSHESQLHVDGDLHLDSRRPFMIDDKHGLVTAGSLSGMGQFEFTAGELTLGTLTLGTAPGMRPSLTVDAQFVSETQFSVVGATDIQQEGHLALSKTTTTFDGIVINSGSLYVSESQVTFNGTG